MNINKARAKINKQTETSSEKEVGLLLLDMGLNFIACGKDAEIHKNSKKKIGQIDLIFEDSEEGILFLVEVTTRKREKSEKIDHFFSRWSDKGNIKILRNKFRLPPIKVIKVFFDFSSNKSSKVSASLDHHLEDSSNNLLNKGDFEYFRKSCNMVGKWARNDLYNVLNIEPKIVTRQEDGIQFYLGNVRLYCYVDKVSNLLKYCYIYRRRKNGVGYQRTLNEKRMGSISKAIKSGKTLAFPNSILINCPNTVCNNPASPENCPKHVKLSIPNSDCVCRIVDGQHRLLGFAKLSKHIQESYSLPVIVFENLDPKEEMKAFIDINTKQKRIDINLILLLKSDFDWDEGTREFFQKIAVEVAMKLNDKSPLKGKIYFGTANEKRDKKITLATLVSVITKNNFIGKKIHLFQKDINDIEGPYENIKKIFQYLRKYLGGYSSSKNPLFYKNRGLRILFRFVQILERNRKKGFISFELEEGFDYLSKILDIDFKKQLEDYYGEGGANKAVQEIFRKLKKDYRREFKKIKLDLRSLL